MTTLKKHINLIYKAYEKAADQAVQNGNNTDAAKLLKKAITYNQDDDYLKYICKSLHIKKKFLKYNHQLNEYYHH